MRAYVALFTHSDVRRLAIAAVATRIAAPMLSLSILLGVEAAYGSLGAGGLVLTGYAAALAVGVPVAGRLADRFQPLRVLLWYLVIHVIAYVLLILFLWHAVSVGALVGSAILLGVSTPPAGPIVRSSWQAVVPKEQVKTAFALDAVLNETMFVTGPLIVSALVAIASPLAAVIFAGSCTLAGVTLLLTVPALRARQAGEAKDGNRFRRLLGPLGQGQVRVLLTILVCDTLAFSSIIVGITALATAQNAASAPGILLSLASGGAVVSALLYGARERKGQAQRQLAMYHAASAVLLAIMTQVDSLVLAAVVLVGVGLVGGPRDTLHQLVLGEAAPADQRTEAFAWMSTFMWVGYALGTALAGQLVTAADGGSDTTFVAAAGAAALAALASLLVRPAPQRVDIA
ncbi:MFS transporter [Kibdelosporangium persicum]|uniref:Arabinose efflux permease, MFS family n=1 Tax=Kibdelosporangium persicum TaxID=2698649 RepID=A0ABX2FIJ1_9PSEU|nr:MFS transporter [Kibdelosporangium persicum]NRN71107.1 putative arabinose efflux permease, MFS family [Kibdelosporangium persicum]